MSVDDGVELFRLSRRRFLAYGGAAGSTLWLQDLRSAPPAEAQITLPPFPATLTRTARRREDFLSITFEFRNLKLNGSTPRRLVKIVSTQPAYIVAILPPQHLAEEAFGGNTFPAPGDVRAYLANPSRLAFEVPASQLPMAFTIDRLLDWVQFPQRVPQSSGAPKNHETAIEIPWFLVLSPHKGAGWAHSRVPVTHGPRTELWHTRLGKRVPGQTFNEQGQLLNPHVDETDAASRTVQAVHARDGANESGLTTSLTKSDRKQIVDLTSKVPAEFRRPIQVNRLMLSPLGGWLNSRGAWKDNPGYTITEWRHRATMGRDSYVRVVRRGYLLPFGHKAILTTITERRFRSVVGGFLGAYLHQRSFITVQEPLKRFGAASAPGQRKDGRGFPFRAVRLLTVSTPDLEDGTLAFFPVAKNAGTEFQFDLVGIDWDGQETDFAAPLLFVPADLTASQMHDAVNLYNAADQESIRRRSTSGQHVAFAPSKKRGDASFPTGSLVFQVEEKDPNTPQAQIDAALQPNAYPRVQEAHIRMPAAEQTAGADLGETRVEIDLSFVDFGFKDMLNAAVDAATQNAGEVFLKLLDDATGLSFGDAAKSGGIATPDLSISALSRALGPLGGTLETLRQGIFDPADFFDETAKLLGSLRLVEIIQKLTAPTSLGENGPIIQTVMEPEPPAIPKKIITKLDWEPKLKGNDLFVPETGASLTLHGEVTTDLVDPGQSTFKVDGELEKFALHLFGGQSSFIILHFEKVEFTAEKDKKPDLDIELGDVNFAGPLLFVEEFRKFLSSLGTGFSIDVSAKGIDASLTIPLPKIAVGVFVMKNLSISLGTIVPFDGDPVRFRFSFCSRENPFNLSIAMFGGGGFFAFECGTDHSVMLEVSLEFGAHVEFNVGVASGGVEVMAGIYIKVETDSAKLTGFLRMGGHLSILGGLLGISMELYLGFTYISPEDKCIGKATFHLEIEIFFFTISVSAEVERKFGGEGDPTFDQLMSPTDWDEYCNAYAPIGAP